MLEIGMKGKAETIVTIDNTAKAFTSGALDVFATPAMISLMEETCWKMIQPELEEGSGSVGTKVDVSHTAPSAIGMTVKCEATLTEIDGRKLTFEVVCSDENGVVGMGTHERFIINNEKFMAKAQGRH
ncbi:thioesterase family protein [Pseudobutyrivibrio sp.]|uniref:thioesterase family protein n=1 Tax=Pseudobutyrivibrio sp. TaxID=2014367 RepID=UPI001D429BEC|nr:thioesterase family protein [Pseudobutyrivibrio sp.]MBE5911279.1 thioesterase [Pseudobutyrivibrio sp.]